MTLERETPPREKLIKPDPHTSLQEQIGVALREGVGRVILEGHFTPEHANQFSMVTIPRSIEIVGVDGATIDGENRSTHLVFIADGISVNISNVRFVGGNTHDRSSQASFTNHPGNRLNIFRYLDGGAISLGMGSELVLEDAELIGNHSAVCGGAISNLGGYLLVRNSTFINNSCGDTGAAIDNLAAGSLSVIENCRFANNRANELGGGTYGAVTVFPNTFLVVKASDFSGEETTAIDYQPNRDGMSSVFIDHDTVFNSGANNPVVINPSSNTGTRKEILTRYLRLFARHPSLIKLERIPAANREIVRKHQKFFAKATSTQ